jgi:uncharacterized membrane protein YesL
MTGKSYGQFFVGVIIALLLSPVTFFPATAAMFSVVRKWVNGSTDVPMFKSYFRAYKENYKLSLIGGLIFSLLFAVVSFNLRFYSQMKGQLPTVMTIVFVFILIVSILVMFSYFSVIVHLRLTLKDTFKNSILITLYKPLFTFIQIAGFLAVGILTWKFKGVILFFSASFFAYIYYMFFDRKYATLVEVEDVSKDQ